MLLTIYCTHFFHLFSSKRHNFICWSFHVYFALYLCVYPFICIILYDQYYERYIIVHTGLMYDNYGIEAQSRLRLYSTRDLADSISLKLTFWVVMNVVAQTENSVFWNNGWFGPSIVGCLFITLISQLIIVERFRFLNSLPAPM